MFSFAFYYFVFYLRKKLKPYKLNNNNLMRNFTMIQKKIGAVHLIKSYGDEGRKYLEVLRIKYLVLPKCEIKYQKMGPNTNLV